MKRRRTLICRNGGAESGLAVDSPPPHEPAGTIFELKGIERSFQGGKALRGVDLVLQPGRIHALIGENGAGKSTLINIATGVLQPDRGQILVDGRLARVSNPREAARLGIHVVHQEAELFSQLSLAENMLLSEGLVHHAWLPLLIDWPATYDRARQALAAMSTAGNVQQTAGALSLGQRVQANIAAAVSRQARVLLLDEPTASLTQGETRRLLEQLHRLKAAGVAILYVSHRLEEVLEISDTITILRDGSRVACESAAGLTVDQLVTRMVGRELEAFQRGARVASDEALIRLCRFSSPKGEVRDISLEVHRGEIVGLYGLVGAGRSELARAIFGLDPHTGELELSGRPLPIHQPVTAMKAGLAYLPEDRLNEAIFATHSCQSNLTAAALRQMGRFGLIFGRRERDVATRVIRELQVRLDTPEQSINTLSGGNQQKLVLGRWLETRPEMLILDEPTRGVDVGAKAQIHRMIDELAAQGKAILLISSELPEVMQLSDRVLVLAEGRLAGEFDPRKVVEDELVAAALPKRVKRGGLPEAGSSDRTSLPAAFLRVRELGILAALAVICFLMAATRPHEFATVKNFLDVLTDASIVAVGATGMTLVILTGGIDISVGRMLGLVGAAAGLLAMRGAPPAVCLGVAVGLGALLGSLNSVLSALGRIHPIVVTLAGMSVYQGLMQRLTGGYEVHPLPSGYRALADGSLWQIPKMLWWALLVLGGCWILLQHTLLGRRMLAVGNSEKAARLIGLSPWRLRLTAFAIMGALIGLGAVMWGAYYGKVQQNTGEGFELKVIAAAVVGGCSIMGGRGTALGAFSGAVLIALIYNCLVILKINAFWQGVFVGGLIFLAVLVDLWLPRLIAPGRRGSAPC
jgi:rhamnose transport system ATP-binding protein